MVYLVLESKFNGIGGIFFFSSDPEKSREWYAKHLGLATNAYGSSFEFRNANEPDEINYLQWSPFKEGDAYFEPSKKEFMINYRIQNIEGLVNKLKKEGVEILDEIESFDYGKFVHIMDHEGKKLNYGNLKTMFLQLWVEIRPSNQFNCLSK